VSPGLADACSAYRARYGRNPERFVVGSGMWVMLTESAVPMMLAPAGHTVQIVESRFLPPFAVWLEPPVAEYTYKDRVV